MKRFFDQQQRSVLAWISGGRCAICKQKLEKGFHADHVLAFANGGRTITKNGQALCQKCNLSKGIN
jgi:5-methylcytosine-specific restriction endonuclease McrA